MSSPWSLWWSLKEKPIFAEMCRQFLVQVTTMVNLTHLSSTVLLSYESRPEKGFSYHLCHSVVTILYFQAQSTKPSFHSWQTTSTVNNFVKAKVNMATQYTWSNWPKTKKINDKYLTPQHFCSLFYDILHQMSSSIPRFTFIASSQAPAKTQRLNGVDTWASSEV